ncbi:uncharacterized protein LOC133307394 [Gastrolobium bilobum]|uniref:uncharacterized protein LOC133307394 n=1 Tax=Gastrolobium bilobum TaxID=150636 RepID=UPI002AAF4266|nr:uncharacterized protein LOC133307394 [Gastrolobium bilobum]
MSIISSPFPSCFRLSKTTNDDHHHPPPLSTNPNLTTYIYDTDAGTVSLTWSRSILGRSFHIHLPFYSSFHLHIKPFLFWNNHGSKKLSHNTLIFWNLSNARFGSGPEPHSSFYVAVVVDNKLILLVGDISTNDAHAKCKAQEPNNRQLLVLKREHVDVAAHQRVVYTTRTRSRGREIEIEIEIDSVSYDNNSRLLFCVDGEKVLEVKMLKWKFRGNERVEVDGVSLQISWDVCNWLFENDNNNNRNGHAVFMFKFEEDEVRGKSWSVSSCAGSFGGSSSVMEWSSVEENELVVPLGFSLLVYASKR